jgi:hypothetical protein
MSFRPATIACSLLLCLTRPAPADPASDAKQHFESGVALAQRHEFVAAIDEFEASYRANPVPEVRMNIALSHKALGHPVEAIAEIRRYLAEGEARPKGLPQHRKDEALAVIIELEAQVATFQITAPVGAEVRVDDLVIEHEALAAVKVDPGTHRVELSAPGFAPVHVDTVLTAGQRYPLEMAFGPSTPAAAAEAPAPHVPAASPREAPAAPASSASRSSVAIERGVSPPPRSFLSTPRGYFALASGIAAVAAMGMGTVTGIMVLDDRSKYRTSCQQTCDDNLYSRAHSLANTTDVLLAIGGAAAITSAVLVLTRPSRSRVAVVPSATTGQLGLVLEGEF